MFFLRGQGGVIVSLIYFFCSFSQTQMAQCSMMFAEDIVICGESREQVKENTERWRFALQ